jgi:hypothetical protein
MYTRKQSRVDRELAGEILPQQRPVIYNEKRKNTTKRTRRHNTRVNVPVPLNINMAAAVEARYTCPVPKYSGDSDVRRYLQKFQSAMETNNWPKDTRWLPLLAASLEGSAEKFYYTWLEQQKRIAAIPPVPGAPVVVHQTTYDLLAHALQVAFKSYSDKNMVEERCRQRKQKLNESVETYTFELLALLEDLDPDMSEIERVRHLLRNSRADYRKLITIHNPTTVDIFLELMRKVEYTNALSSQFEETNITEDICGVKSASEQTILQGRLDNLTTLVVNSQIENQRQLGDMAQRQESSTVTCFRCGGNHYSTFCPQPRDNRGQGNRQQNGANNRMFFCTVHGQNKTHGTNSCRVVNPQQRPQGNGYCPRNNFPQNNNNQGNWQRPRQNWPRGPVPQNNGMWRRPPFNPNNPPQAQQLTVAPVNQPQ